MNSNFNLIAIKDIHLENKYPQRKAKNISLILLTIGLFILNAFIFLGIIYFYNSKPSKKPNIIQNDNSSTYTQDISLKYSKMYFVVQTGWKNYQAEILTDNISGRYFSSGEWRDVTEKLLNIEVTQISSKDYYEEYMKLPADSFIIMPYFESDYRLKTVTVDSINFWDAQDNLLNYPFYANVDEKYDEFDSSKMTTYVAGGELIPARDVLNRKREKGTDFLYNLANIRHLFEEADISSAILENPIAGHPQPDCHNGCFSFIGDEDFKLSLQDAGIDVVSFGNHIGDKGKDALAQTLANLDEVGVLHTGLSLNNQDEASMGAVKQTQNLKFGFLGYDDVAYYYWAGENRWGSARYSFRDENGVQSTDFEKLKADIERLENEVDVLVAMTSWGEREYVNYASERQREVAHFMIENGVDIIVASHQHWVSEIEFYQGKPIYYGLGNLLFDQTHTEETRQSAAVKFYFYGDKIVSFDYVPMITWGYHQITQMNQMVQRGEIVTPYNLYQPYFLNKSDPAYDEVFNRMLENSDI